VIKDGEPQNPIGPAQGLRWTNGIADTDIPYRG